MKIEKISDGRLQILVSANDLTEHQIDIKDLWQNGPRAQLFFTNMIQRAFENGELPIESMRLSVEAIGLIPEGVIVILNRHSSRVENSYQVDPGIAEENEQVPRRRSSVPREVAYVFNSFEDVLAASQRLVSIGIHRGDLVYFHEKFHLVVRLGRGLKARAGLAILGEYGEKSSYTPLFFSEHGTVIHSDDAPMFISQTFDK